jgi:hypothetical protein
MCARDPLLQLLHGFLIIRVYEHPNGSDTPLKSVATIMAR